MIRMCDDKFNEKNRMVLSKYVYIIIMVSDDMKRFTRLGWHFLILFAR